MLKIKDNVDLKELEKYGFKGYRTILSSDGNIPDGVVEYSCSFDFGKGNYGQGSQTAVTVISVNPNTREVSEYTDGRFEMFTAIGRYRLDVLFELIKAGLVEKVEA